MNELFDVLSELLTSGSLKTNHINVKVEQDDKGNVTIKYTNPQNNEEVKKIREEIDELDDDIFTSAAELLKNTDIKAFAEMSKIEHVKDVKNLKAAYEIFKKCVVEVAEKEIKELTERINYLYNRYLDSSED